MTQKDKELLLKDLCARLPYGVIVQQSAKYPKGHIMYNVADKWDTEPHDFKIIGVEGVNTLITDKRKEERTYAKGIVSSPITICIHNGFTGQVIKPYLRPMSSMSEEERIEFSRLLDVRYCGEDWEGHISTSYCIEIDNVYTDDEGIIKYPSSFSMDAIDWLNTHHFDYRGLIRAGLALEAPKGIYNT